MIRDWLSAMMACLVWTVGLGVGLGIVVTFVYRVFFI